MSLRLAEIGRIGSLAVFTLVGCSSDPTPPSGSGGGGAGNPGGMSNAGSSGGSAGGSSGSVATGGSSGSVATGGAGSSAGGAGGSAGGSGGNAGGSGGDAGGSGGSGGAGGKSKTTFFVTSDKSMTGKLGGLEGADLRCQTLATAAGITGHTFHAYLSTSTVDAKTRIGPGPWYNSKGVLVAENVAALHALKGNSDLFVDEKMQKINGQWSMSPTPNEHDILTGSTADGSVQAGKTCMDWTSDSDQMTAQVGHCDGLGPNMGSGGALSSWNSAHENGGCDDTAPKGGAGRLYCFAIDP